MARKKREPNQTAEQLVEEYTQAAHLHRCEWGELCDEKDWLWALAELWDDIHYARNPHPNSTNDGEWFV